jgi:hypothetical protein
MAAMLVTPGSVLHDWTRLLRSALPVVGDLFLAMGVEFCISLVNPAIGIPIELVLQLLLWLARLM